MIFPTLVYRCPGTHQCKGGTFDYAPAADAAELHALIKDGWYPTLPMAQDPSATDIEGYLQTLDILEGGEAEPESPTLKELSREALEAKAKELGVKFNKQVKDKMLIARIEEMQAIEE